MDIWAFSAAGPNFSALIFEPVEPGSLHRKDLCHVPDDLFHPFIVLDGIPCDFDGIPADFEEPVDPGLLLSKLFVETFHSSRSARFALEDKFDGAFDLFGSHCLPSVKTQRCLNYNITAKPRVPQDLWAGC